MISQEDFLKEEFAMGVSNDNPEFVNLANATVKHLGIDYNTVLDYGAGIGVYSDAFHREGKDVKVFEIWQPHREYIAKTFPYLQIVEEPCTTDLLVWIEVAEHMTDEEIDTLLKSIKPKYILFSSTPNKSARDEDWGHINIKDHEGWILKLAEYGYIFEHNLIFPTPWAKLFVCE
jgi:2-polyprenyl-3-methyl-5-hydroxy-6-metoxy-1,4-benzoquinol methylase